MAADDVILGAELAGLIVRFNPDGIVVVDADGLIRYVNDAALFLTGWAGSDLLHQPVETLVPATLRDAHLAHRRDYLLQPHPRPMGAALDLRLLRKDGGTVAVEINLAPVTMARGNFIIATVRRRLRA